MQKNWMLLEELKLYFGVTNPIQVVMNRLHSFLLFLSALLLTTLQGCEPEDPIDDPSGGNTGNEVQYRLIEMDLIDISETYANQYVLGAWGCVYSNGIPALTTFFAYQDVSPNPMVGSSPLFGLETDGIITGDYNAAPIIESTCLYDAFEYGAGGEEEVDAFFDGEKILGMHEGGGNTPSSAEQMDLSLVYEDNALLSLDFDGDVLEWIRNNGDIEELQIEGEPYATYSYSEHENLGGICFLLPIHFFHDHDDLFELDFFFRHFPTLFGKSTQRLPSGIQFNPEFCDDIVWSTYDWTLDENNLPIQVQYTFKDSEYPDPITLTYSLTFEAY